jgi:hypothetical protein
LSSFSRRSGRDRARIRHGEWGFTADVAAQRLIKGLAALSQFLELLDALEGEAALTRNHTGRSECQACWGRFCVRWCKGFSSVARECFSQRQERPRKGRMRLAIADEQPGRGIKTLAQLGLQLFAAPWVSIRDQRLQLG